MKASTKTILGLLFSSFLGAFPLLAETKSKHKYFPKDKAELLKLVKDEKIKLDEIDTGKIVDMSFLFCQGEEQVWNDDIGEMEYPCINSAKDRKDFLGIESWDVSNVEDMQFMFNGATSFNQPLNKWNVSKVENMQGMFQGAKSFNQPLEKWNVSKVKDMRYMFYGAVSFNQDLRNWNTLKAKEFSAYREMFEGATSMNPAYMPEKKTKIRSQK